MDLTHYFPEIEIAVWYKVGDIKKFIEAYNPAKPEEVKKIRVELAKFH